MGQFYEDAKFGVVHRKWFGLTKKVGGDCAAGYTIGSGTTADHLARWYPMGPINVLKVGFMVLATLSTPATNADVELAPVRFYKSNSSGTARSTLIASDGLVPRDTGRQALWSINSKETISSPEVEAGRFISIRTGSPTTGDGTVDNGTITGTLAFFLDWTPRYDSGGRWDS